MNDGRDPNTIARHQRALQAADSLAALRVSQASLALQDEMEGAITLLRPRAEARSLGRAARRGLADLMLHLGQRQHTEDPVAAVRTVRSILQLVPNLTAARKTLCNWQRAASKRRTPGPQ